MKKEKVKNNTDKEITMTKITSIICKMRDVELSDILSKKRTDNIVIARQLCIYMAWRYLKLKWREIAQLIGQSHPTAVYARNRIQKLRDTYPTFNQECLKIEDAIKGKIDIEIKFNDINLKNIRRFLERLKVYVDELAQAPDDSFRQEIESIKEMLYDTTAHTCQRLAESAHKHYYKYHPVQ